MNALVLFGKRDLRYLTDWPMPHPKAEEVRVRVKAVGICGGDVRYYKQRYTIPYEKAHIHGHEFSGIVDEIGKDVNNVKVGMRVAVLPTQSCGKCSNCLKGAINICENRKVTGAVRKTGVCEGAMAEYVCVPAKTVIPLPDEVSFEEGALLEVMGASLHMVKQAGTIKNSTVVIYGTGSIGSAALLFFQYFGAKRIIAIDQEEERLELPKRYGVQKAILADDEVIEKVRECTGGVGADIVLNTVGSEKTIDNSMRMCRGNGRMIMAGLEEEQFRLDYRYLMDHEIKLLPSITYTTEMYECLELIQKKELSIADIITTRIPLSEGITIFRELAENKKKHVKVIMYP